MRLSDEMYPSLRTDLQFSQLFKFNQEINAYNPSFHFPFLLISLLTSFYLQTGPFDIVLYDECFRAKEGLGICTDLDLPFSILDPESIVYIVPVGDGICSSAKHPMDIEWYIHLSRVTSTVFLAPGSRS
jgi:hypothetical protein